MRGLGETLVGNYPGRALSAVVNKAELGAPQVLSFPSKSVGLFVDETLIFRSDSNGARPVPPPPPSSTILLSTPNSDLELIEG